MSSVLKIPSTSAVKPSHSRAAESVTSGESAPRARKVKQN